MAHLLPPLLTALAAGASPPQQAASGPMPAPVSAAQNPLPTTPADIPAEARGRRILSTAFVRIGPDGHLTVERGDGRVLVLRDVVMRARDYCGRQVSGGTAGKRHCGGYADVMAARPGGGPVIDARAEPGGDRPVPPAAESQP